MTPGSVSVLTQTSFCRYGGDNSSRERRTGWLKRSAEATWGKYYINTHTNIQQSNWRMLILGDRSASLACGRQTGWWHMWAFVLSCFVVNSLCWLCFLSPCVLEEGRADRRSDTLHLQHYKRSKLFKVCVRLAGLIAFFNLAQLFFFPSYWIILVWYSFILIL